MKKKALLLCGFAVAMLSSTHVYASTMFNFSFTGNSSVSGAPGTPFSGAGVFTANEVGSTSKYTVVGVTGTTDGQAITSLIASGGFGFNDNFLFFSPGDISAALDNSGVSYQLANGVDTNLFLSTTGMGAQQLFGFPGMLVSEEQTANISITPVGASAVPEPGTLVLMGTGIMGLAGAARRKFLGA